MDQIRVRQAAEVQFAHDVLHAVVAGEVVIEIGPEELSRLHVAHDVLSWLLHGECGKTFADNLASVWGELVARGYTPVFER